VVLGMTWLLRILVRSSRDVSAVKAALERFSDPKWVVVESLGGLRGESLLAEAKSRLAPYTVLLLGREDSSIAEELLAGGLPPFTEVIVTKARRVRNNTVESIAGYIDKARAQLRLRASWASSCFRLARGGLPLQEAPLNPNSDSFLLYGRGVEALSELTSVRLEGSLLVYSAIQGLHYAYAGPEPVLSFRLSYLDVALEYRVLGGPSRGPRLPDVVECNRDLTSMLESHALKLLGRVEEELSPRRVIVPWSGGKDSTAALLLAVKAFGSSRVKAVYVDTGVDFPHNREYVEDLSSKLGIDLEVVDAGVEKGLLREGLPLPSPQNRWCTSRKLEALRRVYKQEFSKFMGRVVVVVGDRDAESERRARRPVARLDPTGIDVIAPIRLWSAAHTQVYLLTRGLNLNPLYELGFYRLGCYVCFSLRNWELHLMRKYGLLGRILRERPHHAGLLRIFVESRRPKSG